MLVFLGLITLSMFENIMFWDRNVVLELPQWISNRISVLRMVGCGFDLRPDWIELIPRHGPPLPQGMGQLRRINFTSLWLWLSLKYWKTEPAPSEVVKRKKILCRKHSALKVQAGYSSKAWYLKLLFSSSKLAPLIADVMNWFSVAEWEGPSSGEARHTDQPEKKSGMKTVSAQS